MAVPELEWRLLVDPPSHYPWSVLWRADDRADYVDAIIAAAQQLSRKYDWLRPARDQAVG